MTDTSAEYEDLLKPERYSDEPYRFICELIRNCGYDFISYKITITYNELEEITFILFDINRNCCAFSPETSNHLGNHMITELVELLRPVLKPKEIQYINSKLKVGVTKF